MAGDQVQSSIHARCFSVTLRLKNYVWWCFGCELYTTIDISIVTSLCPIEITFLNYMLGLVGIEPLRGILMFKPCRVLDSVAVSRKLEF